MIFTRPRAALRIFAFAVAGTALSVAGLPSFAFAAGHTGKTPRLSRDELVSGLIVKPRASTGKALALALGAKNAASLSRIANANLTVVRAMSGGAHVVRFDKPLHLSDARAIAARLMRDGSIEVAEPNRVMRLAAVTPDDPLYAMQWHLMAPSGLNRGGANLPAAWSVTTGSPSVTVAVVDTGILTHADIPAGSILSGYDFMTNFSDPAQPRSNDGNGRDADPSDPGDYATASDSCYDSSVSTNNNSSWHGTHVAGTIIAALNNSVGVAGIAPGVKLLPVRALGTCGGLTSDIIDGMRWAAGLTVPGVPTNTNPAQILNLSFGAPETCSTVYQNAVDEIVGAGKTIFAATGNDNVLSVSEPANCTGVIAVTAHSIDGDTTDYANIGPETTISAPGGGCGDTNSRSGLCDSANTGNNAYVVSTFNSGTTAPVADAYAGDAGTSMAVPHAAGVAALMLSRDPTLTPAKIRSFLRSSARAFPATSACRTDASYVGKCGAGLLDASNALAAITAAPPVTMVSQPSMVVAPGSSVALSGTATPGTGRAIAAYAWTQSSGNPVSLAAASSANASFTAPATGTYSFTLTATDNGGQTGTANAVVRVNSPPVLQPIPAQSVAVGNALTFAVTATDADGDTPIFSAASLPSGATLSASGVFNWPDAAPAGDYTMTYYANDNDTSSTQGTVTIHVTGGSSGGGGGSLDGEWLLGLALLALGLRVRRLVK